MNATVSQIIAVATEYVAGKLPSLERDYYDRAWEEDSEPSLSHGHDPDYYAGIALLSLDRLSKRCSREQAVTSARVAIDHAARYAFFRDHSPRGFSEELRMMREIGGVIGEDDRLVPRE